MSGRIPRWMLALLVITEAGTALSYSDTSAPVLVAALAAPVLIAGLTRWPPAALGLGALSAISAGTAVGNEFPPWLAGLGGALVLLTGLAGYRLGRARPALAVIAAGAGVGVVLDLVLHTGSASTSVVLLALLVALPWLIGHALRQQAELGTAAAASARLRERTALAHDMHDTLGHELSLLALRAGALELADGLAAEHRAAAADLRAGAGAATERLAGIVGMLRDGAAPALHPADEPPGDVIARATDAGMTVTFESTVDFGALDATVRRALHRVLTEALTNAAKHAPGAAVQVRLTGTERVELSVRNPLPARPVRAHGTGTGLVGLDERVALAGGTLRTGPRDGEFRVEATLPGVR